MNRIIQRRYIKERLEKNNEEKKEGKDGDLIYKSEVSDLNTNNIPSNIEVQKSTSSKVQQEFNTDIKKESSENNEKNKEDKENITNPKGNRYMNI